MTNTEQALRRDWYMGGDRFVDLAFVATCLVVWVGLMVASAGLTFYGDEWAIIARAGDWSLDDLMRPHNEHWMLGFKLVYKTLMATVGLTSYVPYMAIVLALHVAAAAALYAYARRQTLPLIAYAIGLVFLLLGTAGEDLFYGMQINFNGSTAAGAWALVILMREPAPRRAGLASLLLLVSVAFSGIGLFFLAGAAAIVVVAPQLRRWWWVLLPAVVSYAAWYLVYGGGAIGSVSRLPELIEFTRVGIAYAVGQVSGLRAEVGLVIAVLMAIAALGELTSGKVVRLGLIAGSVGVLAQYVVTGLARAEGGAVLATAPRYIHPAAALILIAVIGWLGHRSIRQTTRSLGLVLAVGGLAATALAWNLHWARSQLDLFRDWASETRAAISLLTTYGGTPAIPAHRGMVHLDDGSGRLGPAAPGHVPLIPASEGLVPLIERWGSPLDDPLSVGSSAVPDVVLDRVFRRLVNDAIRVSQEVMTEESEPMEFVTASGVSTSQDEACLLLTPTGLEPTVVVGVPSGASLYATSETAESGQVSVSLRGTFADDGVAFEMAPGEATRIALPDIGPGEHLEARLVVPVAGETRLCASGGGSTGLLTSATGLDDLVIGPAAGVSLPPASTPPEVQFSHGVDVTEGPAGCIVASATDVDPYVSLLVPDGQGLHVTTTAEGAGQVFVDLGSDFNETDSVRVTFAQAPILIHMPPGADAAGWAIRVDPPDGQAATICLVALPGAAARG